METFSLLEIPELISNKNRAQPIDLPDVKRIKNVSEFMANSDNYDGNINTLTDRLNEQTNQCQNVIDLLMADIRHKKEALRQMKNDLLELQRQLNLPDADERFIEKREKIIVKFHDELETNEYEVGVALNNFSVKMASLYSQIIVLESDIDVMDYMKQVARSNYDCVREWHQNSASRHLN